MMKLAFLVVAVLSQSSLAIKKRHIIYWNSVLTPELKRPEHVQEVKIGEFMDILCPHQSLQGITGRPGEAATFDLFNVTESEYNECHLKGRQKFLFACNRPERENKLTIKFQTISPSPLGFRFQYCADYYFIAFPRGRRHRRGCNKDTTRLHIRVSCKDEDVTKAAIPTTEEATTTTTLQTTRDAKPAIVLNDAKEEIVIPDLTNPFDVEAQLSEDHPRVLKVIAGNRDVGGGENAATGLATSFTRQLLLIAASVTTAVAGSRLIIA